RMLNLCQEYLKVLAVSKRIEALIATNLAGIAKSACGRLPKRGNRPVAVLLLLGTLGIGQLDPIRADQRHATGKSGSDIELLVLVLWLQLLHFAERARGISGPAKRHVRSRQVLEMSHEIVEVLSRR